MKKISLVFLALLCALCASAYSFSFEGFAAGKYAIVMEVDRNPNGSITGRYAYQSTLNDRGRDNRSAWLYITPDGNSKTNYTITDSNGKVQERWSNASFSRADGINYFTVNVVNAKGRSFTLNLHTLKNRDSTTTGIQPSPNTPNAPTRADENTYITAYYTDHINCNTKDMFDYSTIAYRLDTLMGLVNYALMKELFEYSGVIQYNGRYFWDSAFRARYCCDPYVVWAYDPSTSAFYVWMRKDSQELWWSETGSIPSDFQQLVATYSGL